MSAARQMRVRELLEGHADAGATGDVVVHGLSLDSRQVRPRDAFFALAGAHAHGISFAPAASARGAAVILAEVPVAGAPVPVAACNPQSVREPIVPIVWVDRLRDQLGEIAATFFEHPSRTLDVIGVTGTNGKTSTVQLLAQALDQLGHRVATIGTLGAGLHGAVRTGERTTPDAIEVQALLADFRAAGARQVAMEVSSHALDQGRVNGVAFDLAVFTNLTRDHLDYHHTMAAYGAAKRRLFAWPQLRAAVINVDDAFGHTLADTLPAGAALLRYGVENEAADVVASMLESRSDGQDFRLVTPWGAGQVRTCLLGRFNISNLLAVAACLGFLGVPFGAICATLGALTPVAGRMSRLGGIDAQPLIVVDYAHTPDALEQALANLRAHCLGRLTCVFGCGGERDAGKRPQMGAIAERLADRIIITDDNPRREDGDAIVAQILAGLQRPLVAGVERDRARAIVHAIAAAKAGDIVLIAGKGHEPYQEIDGEKRAFDDLTVARHALEQRA